MSGLRQERDLAPLLPQALCQRTPPTEHPPGISRRASQGTPFPARRLIPLHARDPGVSPRPVPTPACLLISYPAKAGFLPSPVSQDATVSGYRFILAIQRDRPRLGCEDADCHCVSSQDDARGPCRNVDEEAGCRLTCNPEKSPRQFHGVSARIPEANEPHHFLFPRHARFVRRLSQTDENPWRRGLRPSSVCLRFKGRILRPEITGKVKRSDTQL